MTPLANTGVTAVNITRYNDIIRPLLVSFFSSAGRVQ